MGTTEPDRCATCGKALSMARLAVSRRLAKGPPGRCRACAVVSRRVHTGDAAAACARCGIGLDMSPRSVGWRRRTGSSTCVACGNAKRRIVDGEPPHLCSQCGGAMSSNPSAVAARRRAGSDRCQPCRAREIGKANRERKAARAAFDALSPEEQDAYIDAIATRDMTVAEWQASRDPIARLASAPVDDPLSPAEQRAVSEVTASAPWVSHEDVARMIEAGRHRPCNGDGCDTCGGTGWDPKR